jgi:hypothetical protein
MLGRTRRRFAVTFLVTGLLVPSRVLAQPAPPQPPRDQGTEPTPAPPASPPANEPDKHGDSWKSPAKAADPPLLPAPGGGTPTSTSGTDLAPSEAPSAGAIVVSDKEGEAARDARIRALEARIANDERRMKRLEDRVSIFKNLRFESFIQPQLLIQSYNDTASPNVQVNGQLPPGIEANDTIAKADGTTTNGTFFRVRRARLRTFYETDITRLFLQIDAFPVGGVGPGIGTILRQAEATGIARWTRDIRTEFTMGLFFTPFRRELLEPSLYRPFIERTWFVQNCFPIERDYGAHAKTIAIDDRLVVDLAVVNGQRLGERTFVALPDLNRSKDAIAYLTYKLGFVTLGASAYLGRGQVVDPAALRFKQFDKWAVNYQVLAEKKVVRKLGDTRLSAEFTIARNMDAGVIYSYAVPRIPADFQADVQNLDERALYIRLEQDVGRHFLGGYRYDMYTPDTSIKNNARDAHAFLAVAKISPNLRWMNELTWAIDNVHPTGTLPSSKHILMFSSVLQAMF